MKTINISNIVPSANTTFWQIVKETKWDGNVSMTKSRFLVALEKHGLSAADFGTTYNGVIDVINENTLQRCKKRKPSFSKKFDALAGGDDTHFSDLPAEMISRGKKDVDDYLNGGLADYQARECFSYAVRTPNT